MEYVGLAPPFGSGDNLRLNWVKTEYPADVTSCEDVSFSNGDSDAEVGAWGNLAIGTGFFLTGRVFEDVLYGYRGTSGSTLPCQGSQGGAGDGVGGGCCANTITKWPKGGGISEVDLSPAIRAAGQNLCDATHSFDVGTVGSRTVAFCMVHEMIDGLTADAIVAVDLTTGTFVPTASGASYFSFFAEIGTTSQLGSEHIWKLQFDNSIDRTEQWHGNGVNIGPGFLAVTQKVHGLS